MAIKCEQWHFSGCWCCVGTAFGIVLPAMARAVGSERRQWALGLGTAAGSFGQFLVVPAVPPTSGLVAFMFGTRYLSLLYGLVFLSHQLGSFSGVWLGGWIYDHYGTYNIVWWLSVGLAVAAIAHLPIKEKSVSRVLI